jgi:hypothetical protein
MAGDGDGVTSGGREAWRARLFRPHTRRSADGQAAGDGAGEVAAKVTNIELFFDLVFVFGLSLIHI